MARPTLRIRDTTRISYAESSASNRGDDTDEDGDVNLNDFPPSPSSPRLRTSTRTRASTSVDYEISHTYRSSAISPQARTSSKRYLNSTNSSQELSVSARPTKRQRTRVSYRESSSDDEDESEPDVVVTFQRRPSRPQTAGRPKQKVAANSRTCLRSPRKIRKSQLGSTSKPPPVPERPMESDGVIPSWHTLPYEILLCIFKHVLAHPSGVHGPTAQNVNLVIDMACSCKDFTEPALTALYECPPLRFLEQPHSLMALLRSHSTGSTAYDYARKIKRLEMDTRHTLAFSVAHLGQLRLADLVTLLPALRHLDITNEKHRPPYRAEGGSSGTWYYPVDLFSSMSTAGTRLTSWRCCASLISNPTRDFMDILFLEPCLQSLTHLTLSHMWLDMGDDYCAPNSIRSDALRSLKDLQSLTLEACEIHSSWKLLDNLPNKLQRFSVIYCTSFNAKALNPFLVEHGSDLRELVLNHNNCLDLSFLPDLKSSCPKLEILQVDLSYYSSALLFQNADAEPLYETLLQIGQTPTWPSSLRQLEMVHLRKWDPKAALGFLESLAGSAHELPNLRILTLKAMINVSWRERADLRDRWLAKLEKVFLRNSPPPNPHLASFKTYRLWEEEEKRIKKEAEQRAKEEATASPKRATRSDKRVSRSAAAAAAETSEDEDDMVIQGMCEKVDVTLDNQRPAELTFTAHDFLDSAPSSEDEWDGSEMT